MLRIDRLSYSSQLRYVSTGEKFAFSVVTMVLCIAGQRVVPSVLVFFVMGFFTVLRGKIPFSDYRKLLTIPLAFLAVNAVILGISVRREPLEVFAVSVGAWYVTAGKETIDYGIRVFFTAMASVSCMYFLACNTTMTDLLTLFRRMKCPPVLVELMLLIYRFIFVLLDCAHAISTAQQSRLGYRDYKTSIQSFGGLASHLFICSIKRSERLYDAMEARGYDGTIQVLDEEHPPKKSEIVGIAVFELCLVWLLWG